MSTYVGTDTEDSVVGTLWDDTIQGGGGDDILSGGGGGTDRLEGGAGNDTYYMVDAYGDVYVEAAGEGIDTLVVTTGGYYLLGDNIEILRLAGPTIQSGAGNGGDNSIYGNDIDNWLYGNGGDDVLIAGQGADMLEGGAGADTLHGGDGDDSYRVTDVGDVVVEFAGEGVDTVQVETAGAFATTPFVLAANVEKLVWWASAGAWSFTNTMVGNGLANVITDEGYANTIQAGAGADQVNAGMYEDRVEGGDGDDYLDGAGNNDTLSGGAGADLFVADAYMGDDVIEDFTAGVDNIVLLNGMVVKEIVQEGADARVVFDYVYAPDDSMLLKNVAATDIDAADFLVDFRPEAPAEVAKASAPDQTLSGDAGFDYLRGDWGNDVVSGLDGDDDLYGNAGKDTLRGGAGKDNLDGEGGVDRMEGGAGNDTYVVRDAGDRVIELAGEGVDEVRANLDGYLLEQNVERLDLSFGQAVTATGNADDNRIQGNVLNNVLNGAGGADELRGGGGADLLQGGGGDDRLDGGLDAPGTAETNYRNIGDTLTGGAGADRFMVGFRFENGFEPNGADIVTDFTDGEDLIEAWGVLGWEDIVSIVNEDGTEDTLVVFDDMEYFDATLLLKGVSADQITAQDFIFGFNGTSFADTLEGTANNDYMDAGLGADVLNGGAGADQMIGGGGNDTYVVGKGDSVEENAGEGADTVQTAGSYTLGDNVENLQMTDSAPATGQVAGAGSLGAPALPRITVGRGNVLDNKIWGSSLDNTLTGEAGADVLDGGKGRDKLWGGEDVDRLLGGDAADQLIGGAGADVLTGGVGADRFIYRALSDGGDRILDFKAAAGDLVDLRQIDADAALKGNQAFHFVGKFSGDAGEAVLRYNARKDLTTLQLDADGDGRSDFALTLEGQVGTLEGWVL